MNAITRRANLTAAIVAASFVAAGLLGSAALVVLRAAGPGSPVERGAVLVTRAPLVGPTRRVWVREFVKLARAGDNAGLASGEDRGKFVYLATNTRLRVLEKRGEWAECRILRGGRDGGTIWVAAGQWDTLAAVE